MVYPGDPCPKKETVCSMEKGDLYNLTAFSMCAHNGTHVDAPYHFLKDGKTIDELLLNKMVGWACVFRYDGNLGAKEATEIVEKADGVTHILIKGNAVVCEAAAKVFAKAGLDLVGNESQTVGPPDAPMAVHKILLGAEVVLLEGIRLENVPEGRYFLCAAPLNLGGSDGAPCRAILCEMNEKENLRQ